MGIMGSLRGSVLSLEEVIKTPVNLRRAAGSLDSCAASRLVGIVQRLSVVGEKLSAQRLKGHIDIVM
jgi:hypothetical protein